MTLLAKTVESIHALELIGLFLSHGLVIQNIVIINIHMDGCRLVTVPPLAHSNG